MSCTPNLNGWRNHNFTPYENLVIKPTSIYTNCIFAMKKCPELAKKFGIKSCDNPRVGKFVQNLPNQCLPLRESFYLGYNPQTEWIGVL